MKKKVFKEKYNLTEEVNKIWDKIIEETLEETKPKKTIKKKKSDK